MTQREQVEIEQLKRNKADRDADGNLILPTASGTGVKLGDLNTADFGWKDLIGSVIPKTSGGTANTPTLRTFRGANVRQFSFSAADKIDIVYHMPHDWVPSTDLYIHVHWAHNGTNISGSFVFDFYTTFAKGFQQGAGSDFPAETNTTLTVSSLDITNTPQYRHRTDEVALSASGGGAGLLDTDDLEVDGRLLVQGVMTTIPTITAGDDPFILTIDVHYQSHGAGTTAGKAPDFYTP